MAAGAKSHIGLISRHWRLNCSLGGWRHGYANLAPWIATAKRKKSTASKSKLYVAGAPGSSATSVKGIDPLPIGSQESTIPDCKKWKWSHHQNDLKDPCLLSKSNPRQHDVFLPGNGSKAMVWCPTPRNHGPPCSGTCAIWATGTCWWCKGSHAVTSRQHRSGQVTYKTQVI